MRYVAWRDDDTNAFTPVHCLERLYRPFLQRGLPVNLSVIPSVKTGVRRADGEPEGYLFGHPDASGVTVPIGANKELSGYLLENPGYHVVQHGCHHDLNEFERTDPREVWGRIEKGSRLLGQAGFREPTTFVAPYDRFSPVSMSLAARRFDVVSTGWFEWRRVPRQWRARYLWKKIRRATHWRVGRTLLLSHPGCVLSYTRPRSTMAAAVRETISERKLTVIVTHWWEYFRGGRADEGFIRILHETAEMLAGWRDLRVVNFGELASGAIPVD